MARKARVEFEGAVYHVVDRGDRREAIFKDDADRRRFLETLGEVCARSGRRVHAFVVMSNHSDPLCRREALEVQTAGSRLC